MNLLITGAWNTSERELSKLEELGFKVFLLQNESDVLPLDAGKIDAVVCNSLFLFHPVGEFTRLKLIQLTSAGLDRVPVEEIRAQENALKAMRSCLPTSISILIRTGAEFTSEASQNASALSSF